MASPIPRAAPVTIAVGTTLRLGELDRIPDRDASGCDHLAPHAERKRLPSSGPRRGTPRSCRACRGFGSRCRGRASSRRSDPRARAPPPSRGLGSRALRSRCPLHAARRRRCRSSCESGVRRRPDPRQRRLSARRVTRSRRAWRPPAARDPLRHPRVPFERAVAAGRRRRSARRSTAPRPIGPRPAYRRSSSRCALRAPRLRHALTVGKAQLQAPVVRLGANGQQRRHALRVEERTLVVDQVVAAVAADAGELELDRVDRRQPQRLDGCE